MKTCLVAPQALAGEGLTLSGPAHRHLFRAARLTVGESLRLVDGDGRARLGRVEAVDRRAAEIRLGESLPSCEPSLVLTVWSPVPKPSRASWMVEKLTEVGVHAVCFYRCQRAPRHPGPDALERLRRVAAAAVEQCGRSRLPQISGVHEWPELLMAAASAGSAWALDSTGTPRPPVHEDRGSVLVVAGPEGGLTADELPALEAAGCRRLSLGPTTLRVETAAIVGSALLLAAGA